MNLPTVRQLRYFDALVETKSFGRAAKACAVTQPALSMQIQEFERLIGAELIERSRRGAQLTADGEIIAQRARKILADLQDLGDSVRRTDLLSGRLRFGLIPTIAPYPLPELPPVLRARHGGLTVMLRESQTAQLLDELARGEIDVALLALPIEASELETLHLLDDHFLLATPASDPRPDDATAFETMRRTRLLLLEEGHCLRDQALNICSASGAAAPETYGASSLTTVAQMVSNGYGATLLPELCAPLESTRAAVRLTRFQRPEPMREIGLAWRATSPRKCDFEELGSLVRNAALSIQARLGEIG